MQPFDVILVIFWTNMFFIRQIEPKLWKYIRYTRDLEKLKTA